MEILSVRDLSFTYAGGDSEALHRISLTVGEGEFLLLCGPSGCGKTTFLRLLKRELAPHGQREGKVYYAGVPEEGLDDRRAAAEIGYVLQSPEAQLVTDRVWHELAFGMENLGYLSETIRLRVGEIANYFGIDSWFRRDTATLSGGQKQLLNLASVMVLSPRLLLLDEPTSQLDPIAAADFLRTVYRLNRELGMTVILAEHRLEEVMPLSDRVAVMDAGSLVACAPPRQICRELAASPLAAGFPSAARIWYGLREQAHEAGQEELLPLTVKEGKNFLAGFTARRKSITTAPEDMGARNPVLSVRGVWFRYERESPDILRGTELSIYPGEIFSLLGGNGAGKTTLLKVIASTERPYRGKILFDGRNLGTYRKTDLYRHGVALLPQEAKQVFLKDTVEEDWRDICRVMGDTKETAEEKIRHMAEEMGLSHLLGRHPYDLSGGESQRCALVKILLTEPRLLLLDEPTKGMDAGTKERWQTLLCRLKEKGIAVLTVTHDVEFAAEISDRCALFFDGEILSPSAPRDFFSKNEFYTTAASRIARGVFDGAVTVSDVIAAGSEPEAPDGTNAEETER